MNKIKLLFPIVFCFLALLPAPLSAQSGKKVIKGIVKGTQKMPEQAMRASSAAARQAASLPGVSPSASVNSLIGDQLSAPAVNPTVAGLVNRNKKLLFRLQKSVGISSRKAVENLYRWGATPLQKPRLPELMPDRAFVVRDFTALAYPHHSAPMVPMRPHSKYMYRGMGLALDGAAVRNILENGLLVKDVGPRNNDLRLSYASAAGRGAIKSILNEKVINLTDSPLKALHYALQNKNKGMAVLVSVKELPERGSVVTVTTDIAPQQIHELAALLQIDGKPAWCKIELAPEGFQVTPYSVPAKNAKP